MRQALLIAVFIISILIGSDIAMISMNDAGSFGFITGAVKLPLDISLWLLFVFFAYNWEDKQ